MFAILVANESRLVGVLLGGSGRARIVSVRTPTIPALLRSLPSPSGRSGGTSESYAVGV